ncbi:MAG: glycosyltransferase family 2 protein [Pseudomonadales bacterium]|nr:glycosyltransferase family 2 protein [Pseudomonadales bacterium]
MKIAAIIITFHPDETVLSQLLERIQPQVDEIYIIDNSATPLATKYINACQYYHHDQNNPGIAQAQNNGLIRALNNSMTHALLLDQDSEPDQHMVAKLSIAFGSSTAQAAQKVAAVGPMYIDKNSGQHSAFLTLGKWKNHLTTYHSDNIGTLVSTDFLIASGCLISMKALQNVGFMDETLFIDYVDTDWGIRAKNQGYALLGLTGALMQHRMGESSKRLWIGRWREAAVHKSFRYYYIFRNALILYSKPESDFKWRLFHIKRLLMLLVFISLCKNAKANIRYACSGIKDAVLGRSGPMPP